MLFGRRGRRPKTGGQKPVKDDRRGGAPGLHKRGTSAEDWGGSRRGRAARSLTGARGDSHPFTSSKRGSAVRHPLQADRPPHKREIGASRPSTAVSYTHLTLPTIYSV